MQEAILPIMPFIVSGIALVISITVHEFCHGLAAYVQGDTTAQDQGRLTLNPVSHIDPIGTILVPLIMILSHGPVIGWAKPVPFNPYQLKNQRFGPLWVALAGPFSNFVLFVISGYLLKLVLAVQGKESFLPLFLSVMVVVNFVLFLFNLIPISPLDGSRILHALLPLRFAHIVQWLDMYGPFLLLGVLLLEYATFPFINTFIGICFSFVSRLLQIPVLAY